MDTNRLDYRKGLIYLCGLVVSILFLFTAPDGETFFHKLLGLFGIAPGIPLWGGATLYIFMGIPIAAGIFCARRTFKHWRGYHKRFRELNPLLRDAPWTILFLLFLVTISFTPSVQDRIYFQVVRRQTGLRAVTVSTIDERIGIESIGHYKTYTYGFIFNNHGHEVQTFNLKLLYDEWEDSQEVFVTDDTGDIKTFTLPARRSTVFVGAFTVHNEQWVYRGYYTRLFSVVLVNENERHNPNFLVRPPIL